MRHRGHLSAQARFQGTPVFGRGIRGARPWAGIAKGGPPWPQSGFQGSDPLGGVLKGGRPSPRRHRRHQAGVKGAALKPHLRGMSLATYNRALQPFPWASGGTQPRTRARGPTTYRQAKAPLVSVAHYAPRTVDPRRCGRSPALPTTEGGRLFGDGSAGITIAIGAVRYSSKGNLLRCPLPQCSDRIAAKPLWLSLSE